MRSFVHLSRSQRRRVALAPGETASDRSWLAVAPTASLTWTLNVAVLPVAAPLTTPVDAASCSPAGNPPALTAQVYGPTPPLANTPCAYATPATAAGSDVVMMRSGACTASDA